MTTSLPRPWSRTWLGLIALSGGMVWAGAIILGDHSITSAALLGLAIGGAVIAAVAVPRHPLVAFGILFVLASLSRATIELPPGTMRLEQPAILAIVAAVLISGRLPIRRDVRALLPVVVGLGGYLGVLLLASYLHAPDRVASLRFTFWTGLSVVAGAAAFVLVRPEPGRATLWLVLAGATAGAIGIALATAHALLGPSFELGIQGIPDGFPKVYAISWEANLYASYLGALAPFSLEAFRRRPSLGTAGFVVLIVLGLALGQTRGAYLGIVAGLVAYFGALALQKSRTRSLVPALGLSITVLVSSVVVAGLLLPGGRPPPVVVGPSAPPTASPTQGSTPPPSTVPVPGSPSPGSTPSTTPGPTPTATSIPYPDTIGFRAARIPLALEDLRTSPIIGLGASSFGQRHADASQAGAPDHLAFLVLAIPYESGLLGFASFILAISFILVRLARSAIRPGGSLAAAYLASIVSLLVAYQATNAMHFAMNWLLVGAALAVIRSLDDRREERAGTVADVVDARAMSGSAPRSAD